MTARKQVRRMLLAAALTSAPLLSNDVLYAFSATGRPATFPDGTSQVPRPTGTGLKPVPVSSGPANNVQQANGVQQVQYQTSGQAGATGSAPAGSQAGNSSVEAELNKLFRENGQEPPSMKDKDLPHATTPRMENVRPKQLPGAQNQTGAQASGSTAPAKPAAKQNAFQKFFGKLKGKNTKEEATAKAPQPPELRTGSPAQAGAPTQNPAPTQRPAASQGSATAQGRPAQPNAQPQQNVMRSASASQSPGRPAAAQSGATPRPAIPAQGNPPRTQQYVQPGSAPSFLSGSGNRVAKPSQAGATAGSAVNSVPPRAQAAPLQPEPPKASPVDDDFVDPFGESAEITVEDELDLDSLLEIPKTQVSQPLAAEKTPVAATPVETAPVESNPVEATQVEATQVEATPRPDVETNQPESSPFETMEAPAAATEAAPVENPFTGVQLNVSDEEFFGGETTGRAVIEDTAKELNSESFGDPLPPVEDFSDNLPSIDVSGPAVTPARVPVPQEAQMIGQPVQPQPVQAQPVQAQPAAGQNSVDAVQLQQAAEQVRRERQRKLIMARQAETGFKGFCPVELRDQRELVDAKPEFTATFGLQSYQFSSARAKAMFESDPSRYAPAAGGNDVVLLVNTGEEQPGMLDYSLWYRDRLYLFRSRETMSLFSQDPSRFANQY
ncbi:MAG: hypothetical protein JNL58_19030 [Planctomyces sp.]|nr:hypothetical protein [Planctomyces sp.]